MKTKSSWGILYLRWLTRSEAYIQAEDNKTEGIRWKRPGRVREICQPRRWPKKIKGDKFSVDENVQMVLRAMEAGYYNSKICQPCRQFPIGWMYGEIIKGPFGSPGTSYIGSVDRQN